MPLNGLNVDMLLSVGSFVLLMCGWICSVLAMAGFRVAANSFFGKSPDKTTLTVVRRSLGTLWLVTSALVVADLMAMLGHIGGDSAAIGRAVRDATTTVVFAAVISSFWLIPRLHSVESHLRSESAIPAKTK